MARPHLVSEPPGASPVAIIRDNIQACVTGSYGWLFLWTNSFSPGKGRVWFLPAVSAVSRQTGFSNCQNVAGKRFVMMSWTPSPCLHPQCGNQAVSNTPVKHKSLFAQQFDKSQLESYGLQYKRPLCGDQEMIMGKIEVPHSISTGSTAKQDANQHVYLGKVGYNNLCHVYVTLSLFITL